jgi:tetratricopeptide (TPR) repeat protein
MHLKSAVIIGLILLLNFPAGIQAAARPRAEELILQGNRLCEQGKYQEAVAIYLQALNEYNSAHAAYNLGVTYEINLRDMDRALEYYREFLRLEPDSEDARQVRSWMEEIKTTRVAVTPLKFKSLEEVPPMLKKIIISVLKHAHDYYRQGRYNDAVNEYLQILEVLDSPDAYYNLGLIYDKKLNQKRQAIEYYQNFLVLAPNSLDADQVRRWIKEARQAIEEEEEPF